MRVENMELYITLIGLSTTFLVGYLLSHFVFVPVIGDHKKNAKVKRKRLKKERRKQGLVNSTIDSFQNIGSSHSQNSEKYRKKSEIQENVKALIGWSLLIILGGAAIVALFIGAAIVLGISLFFVAICMALSENIKK